MAKGPKLVRIDLTMTRPVVEWLDGKVREGWYGASRSEVIRTIISERIIRELQKSGSK